MRDGAIAGGGTKGGSGGVEAGSLRGCLPPVPGRVPGDAERNDLGREGKPPVSQYVLQLHGERGGAVAGR